MAVDETLLRLLREADAIHACRHTTAVERTAAARRMNEIRAAVAKAAADDVDAKAAKTRFAEVYRAFIAAHHAAGQARKAQILAERQAAIAAKDERMRERAAAIARREQRKADFAQRRNVALKKEDEPARAPEACEKQRATIEAAVANDRRRQLILIQGMRAMLEVPLDRLPNAARIDEIWRSQAGHVEEDMLRDYMEARAKVWRRAAMFGKSVDQGIRSQT